MLLLWKRQFFCWIIAGVLLMKISIASNQFPIIRSQSLPQEIQKPKNPFKTSSIQYLHDFEIIDANVELAIDDDIDGYYQYFSIYFEPTIFWGEALVYADLYLSYEGGPWYWFYTTDNFWIDVEAESNEYFVENYLEANVNTGHYDVRIELVEWQTQHIVAVIDADTDIDLLALPLEDQQKDQRAYQVVESVDVSYEYAGVSSYFIILLQVVLLLKKFHYRLNNEKKPPKKLTIQQIIDLFR